MSLCAGQGLGTAARGQALGCRRAGISSSPTAVFPSPAIALPLPGPLCSPTQLLSPKQVLSPALSVAEMKDELICSCRDASPGFLRSVSAMILLLQNSLALCFPSHLLRKERGYQIRGRAGPSSRQADPVLPIRAPLPSHSHPTEMLVPSPALRCSLLCRQLPLFILCPPGGFCSTPAPMPVPWLEGVGADLRRDHPVSAGEQAVRLHTTLCCFGFCLNCSTPFPVSSLSI